MLSDARNHLLNDSVKDTPTLVLLNYQVEGCRLFILGVGRVPSEHWRCQVHCCNLYCASLWGPGCKYRPARTTVTPDMAWLGHMTWHHTGT